MICPNCNVKMPADDVCEGCGFGAPSTQQAEEDGMMDRLVQDASAPSLATLFQQAKDKGLIGPVTTYGGGPDGGA